MKIKRLIQIVCSVLLFSILILPQPVSAASPTIITSNAEISSLTATLNGAITVTGGFNASIRGFVWDTVTHADPVAVAPGVSDYSNNWVEAGDFGISTFSYATTALTELTTYYYRACAFNADGWDYGNEVTFFIGEEELVYLEFRPDLDETFIRGQAGVPTDATVGEFNGYSLPIWNNDFEELHYIICVPDRWNGTSDILIHIDSALALSNQANKSYKWQILWEHITPNEDIIPATNNAITTERYIYSNNQYEFYQDWLIIDYDTDADDPIKSDDLIAITLRRVTVAPKETDSDEIIVFAIDVLFARGDFLADPEGNTNIYITNFAALMGWIGDADMIFFALIFLCLGLMIGGYALHRSSFAFMGMAAWMALLIYCRIESGGEWGIYMAIFWLCFAGIVICGIEGVMLNKGEEQAEDEARYTSALDQAYKDMDLEIEEKKKNRKLYQ